MEKYSKGMKQRLQIARGLINDPDYIFLDEPTLGLDILIAKELKNYLKALATVQNKGLLLTTHYIREAEELCDYIYLIDNGNIIAEGSPKDIKQRYSRKYSATFTITDITDDFVHSINTLPSLLKVSVDKNTCQIEILAEYDITHDVLCIIKEHQLNLLNITSSEENLEETIFEIMNNQQAIN